MGRLRKHTPRMKNGLPRPMAPQPAWGAGIPPAAKVVFVPQRMPPIAPLMTIIMNCCSGIFLPLKSTWPSA